MSQYTIGDSNTNCHITTNSHNTKNVWKNCTIADDLSALLTWLSPLDPGMRHSDIQERRVNDVGEWLMATEQFKRWSGLSEEGKGDEAVLFCYGNPGVGKTFISSLVVDRLADRTKGQNTAVICFYFDFAARNEQTATSMLGSLLKQLISGMERVPEDISRSLQEEKRAVSGRKPQLCDIVRMLQLITSSQPTFVIIDALDECTPIQRFRLFDSLKEIVDKSPHARIFVTGRPHIRAEIERSLTGRVISVSVGPPKEDIVRFLRVRLGEDETPDAMDECLEADILEKIPGSIPEMFILVSLNIEAILQEATIYRRREMLRKMTPGLGLSDAYGATIERIKAQGRDKSRLGMGALMWISHAELPLKANQLCHALAIELGSTDFNAGNIPSMTTLVNCCQGLITVDKEESTVRLIHFTLKDYFSAHPDIFTRPHSAMAELCLTYLNSPQVKALPVDAPDRYSSFDDHYPFLKYCSLYWGVHANQDLSDCGRSLALQLLQQFDGHVSISFLAMSLRPRDVRYIPYTYDLSAVQCASFFGIIEIVTALLEIQGYGTNRGWLLGNSPLALAAQNGHEEMVKMLVEWEGVNPDEPNYDGQTPLTYAARYGSERMVEILLERAEVNPDRIDEFGRTPLSYAIRNGHEGVVSMLLGRAGVSPDRIDNWGLTLLSHAAMNGQEVMVKKLLGWEKVNPDKPDNRGRTPLSHAANFGHEGVVKMLLERGEVNPDKPDNEGRTPLSQAISPYRAYISTEGAVKMLLERGEVNPDKPDNNGRTPLSHGARWGSLGVVKMLLERREVNPDKPDNNGRTPLSHAAYSGNLGMVKMLLERREVNPDKPDNQDRTPLSYAAGSRSDSVSAEGMVRLLLRREEVSSQKSDNNGRAPLSYAVEAGFEGVVEILLGLEEVNYDEQDNKGRTLLSYAAGSWGDSISAEGVVKMLLKRGEVNFDEQDNDGRTPLSHAAERGQQHVVKILLEREEVIPDKPDNRGRTPLSHAAEGAQKHVVKMLLEREEVIPDKPDNYGRTPLSYASAGVFHFRRERSLRVIEMLLKREGVIPDRTDNDGRTPASYASEYEFEEAVDMLLKRQVVNPDMPDNLGQTPLMLETTGAHEGVVTLPQPSEAVAVIQPNAEQSQPPRGRRRRFFSFVFRRSRKQS